MMLRQTWGTTLGTSKTGSRPSAERIQYLTDINNGNGNDDSQKDKDTSENDVYLVNDARTAVIRHVAVGTHHKRRGTVGVEVEHRFVRHTHHRRTLDRLQFWNVGARMKRFGSN